MKAENAGEGMRRNTTRTKNDVRDGNLHRQFKLESWRGKANFMWAYRGARDLGALMPDKRDIRNKQVGNNEIEGK